MGLFPGQRAVRSNFRGSDLWCWRPALQADLDLLIGWDEVLLANINAMATPLGNFKNRNAGRDLQRSRFIVEPLLKL